MARKPHTVESIGPIMRPVASISIINMQLSPPRHQIVATCQDSPPAIKAKLAELWRAGYRGLWSTGGVSEKKYHGSGPDA